ncbi:MAG: hypothetical protein FWC36_00960 [Spirochaetes bacterium]|nr:hypothetical protein [Spirochaetota bacterium]
MFRIQNQFNLDRFNQGGYAATVIRLGSNVDVAMGGAGAYSVTEARFRHSETGNIVKFGINLDVEMIPAGTYNLDSLYIKLHTGVGPNSRTQRIGVRGFTGSFTVNEGEVVYLGHVFIEAAGVTTLPVVGTRLRNPTVTVTNRLDLLDAWWAETLQFHKNRGRADETWPQTYAGFLKERTGREMVVRLIDLSHEG